MMRRSTALLATLLVGFSISGARADSKRSSHHRDGASEKKSQVKHGDRARQDDTTESAPEPARPLSKRDRRKLKRYVVLYKKSVDDVDEETTQREEADPEGGFTTDFRYEKAVKGFAAELSETQVTRLEDDPEVVSVTPDREVEASDSVPLAAGDFAPTGVRRMDAATTTTAQEASGVAVAVIDTGVDLSHPDLNVSNGTNCIDSSKSAQDGDGHGTHVAGSIAARNNGSGVVGVAPGTKVYAVKVLDDRGSGTLAQEVCGIDWVTAHARSLNIKVANLSLGGDGPTVKTCATTTDPEHKAVCNATAAGVTFAVAAGNDGRAFDSARNSGQTVDTPAALPEVLTVSAVSDSDGRGGALSGSPSCFSGEQDDRYASFSNFAATSEGRAHTIAAPGVCIRSTWNGGAYNTISGTSMATPHIAGAIALCLNEQGVDGPCAGKSPSEIIQKMRSEAESHTQANHGFGFSGDPINNPVSGRYYGYLDWVGPPAADTTRPTATSVAPADGATGASLSGSVAVAFSEPMDHAGTEAAFSLTRESDGASVAGSFSWSANTLVFTPASALAQGGAYGARVTTAATDEAGNPLDAERSWRFTTADFSEAQSILAGTPRATSVTAPSRLNADDSFSYQVNSTTSGSPVAAWYGRFLGVPSTLSNLTVSYEGSGSRTCTQTVYVYDWAASSWRALDTRSVGTTPTRVDLRPAGDLSRLVGGSNADELRVAVRCSRTKRSFYISGNLLQVAYDRP